MAIPTHAKCYICRKNQNIVYLTTQLGNMCLCKTCNRKKFLDGLFDYEKIKAIKTAKLLAEKERLYFPYAVNVARGLYSIAEAKRRQRLDTAQSVDVYDVGHRRPGSFK